MKKNNHNNNIRIMLISDCEISIEDIQKKLSQIDNFSYQVWHSLGLDESINSLQAINPKIDVVLVDLNLFNSGRPREVFKQMASIISDLPIIVFNGSVERNLALSLIYQGAADTITKDQADSDPYRLRDTIESAMARNKVFQRNYNREISQIKRQDEALIRKASNTRFRALEIAQEDNAREMREKNQIIHWMSGGYSVESHTKNHI